MRRYLRSKSLVAVAVLAAALTSLAAGLPASAQPPAASLAHASSTKVVQLVAAMTLDEKLGMVNGWPNGVSPPPQTNRTIGVGFIPGVPRLGIPSRPGSG